MPVRSPARAAFWLAGVWLLLALLAACQPKVPQLPRLSADDVVLAFGDSLTHGTGVATTEAYPAQLQAIIGRQVVNAGVPGETTAQGLARLADALDTHAPRLVLLCLGGNDMLRGMDMGEAEANVRDMVRLIRERGIGLVLIGVPEPRLLSDPPAFYATVAEEFGLPYEGGVFDDVLKSPALKSDPIHPNAQGYRQVAEALAALLAEAGAL
ncbi:MAG: arylesterase [Pseudomonadota bacterium]